MADYDAGEITDRERLAAEHQKEIAKFNAEATRNQLAQQLANYDFANRQNRRLADVQLQQNSRKSESDRFNALRDLQNATVGLLGSMNQAMNGSTIGNLMRMLENRNDRDNDTYWTQLQTNQDQVNNAYEESVNQNQVAKNDAAINAEQALRSMEGDLAANLNNINPNLYENPNGSGGSLVGNNDEKTGLLGSNYEAMVYGDSGYNGSGYTTDKNNSAAANQLNESSAPTETPGLLGSNGFYEANRASENMAKLSDYLMPNNSVQAARDRSPRNRLSGSDYFSRLINRFNGRY